MRSAATTSALVAAAAPAVVLRKAVKAALEGARIVMLEALERVETMAGWLESRPGKRLAYVVPVGMKGGGLTCQCAQSSIICGQNIGDALRRYCCCKSKGYERRELHGGGKMC